MFILMIILTAFLCGLNNIYVPYQETERLGKYARVEVGWAGGSLGPSGWSLATTSFYTCPLPFYSLSN